MTIRHCQVDASCYWRTVQQEGGVILCGHPSDSNLSPCRLTWCPCCQLFFRVCSTLFPVFDFLEFPPNLCDLECLSNIVLGFHALLSSLFILSACNVISIGSSISLSMQPNFYGPVPWSLGTRSGGLI